MTWITSIKVVTDSDITFTDFSLMGYAQDALPNLGFILERKNPTMAFNKWEIFRVTTTAGNETELLDDNTFLARYKEEPYYDIPFTLTFDLETPVTDGGDLSFYAVINGEEKPLYFCCDELDWWFWYMDEALAVAGHHEIDMFLYTNVDSLDKISAIKVYNTSGEEITIKNATLKIDLK